MRLASFIQRAVGPVGAAIVIVAASACTDTETVYKDRPPFNPPPDETNGFLGFYDASTKQTTCGNCHVTHQTWWTKHKHSEAWDDLVASGGQQAFCNTCHTVSGQGNAAPDPAGYDAVPDAAYHNVQCESCHGAGLVHVTTPDASPPPLAHVGVLGNTGDNTADSTTQANSCAACHSGEHNPFVEEWSQSGHAVSLQEDDGTFVADISPTCGQCHEGRAALRAWGVTSNFAERDSVGSEHYKGVTCAVCHDPHGNDNPADLRYPLNDPSIDNQMCMKCHSRRAEPEFTSSRGPHAPQGQVLLGTAGWTPPDYAVPEGPATHGNVAANPELCATCHVQGYSFTDANNVTTFSTGHTFHPIPCVDATTGLPLPENQQNCPFTIPERRFDNCASASCHGNDVNQAVLAIASIRSTLAGLIDPVWIDTDGDGGLTPGVDVGLFPDAILSGKIPATEFSTTDNKTTVAEGVLFNLRLYGEDRYPNGDRSHGVHNPVQAVPLIVASIAELNAEYGPLPVPPALQQKLDAALKNIPRRGEAARRMSLR
jgi:predicted CXXCH cytochrome family protein